MPSSNSPDDRAQIGLVSPDSSTSAHKSRPLEQPSPEQLEAALHHSAFGAGTVHLHSTEQSTVYMNMADPNISEAVHLYNEMCPMAMQLRWSEITWGQRQE